MMYPDNAQKNTFIKLLGIILYFQIIDQIIFQKYRDIHNFVYELPPCTKYLKNL